MSSVSHDALLMERTHIYLLVNSESVSAFKRVIFEVNM